MLSSDFKHIHDAMHGAQQAMLATGDMLALRYTMAQLLANPIIDSADMYKHSHATMYPDNLTSMQIYLEARRGSKFDDVVHFGLQPLLHELSAIRVTDKHIDEARTFFKQTFGDDSVFAKVEPTWRSIVANGGHLPVEIASLPEGVVVEPGTPLFTVTSTMPEAPWIANFLETRLSRFWYTSTVASVAFHNRQVIERALQLEGHDPDSAAGVAKTGFVDFGLRGVPDLEAGRRGGMAALTSFAATDNTASIHAFAKDYFSLDKVASIGASIPAAEHSVITAHLEANEEAAYRQILDRFPTGMVSIVSDSYDYFAAVDMFCGPLKEVILERHTKAKEVFPDRPHALVVRPDSGDVGTVLLATLDRLAAAFGCTTDEATSFKTLAAPVRIIQGDGVDPDTLVQLVQLLHEHKWSVTNVTFGSGGGLLQKVNRDTCRMAMKANFAIVDGVERPIEKKTPGKASKRGKLSVEEDGGRYVTYMNGAGNPQKNMLQPVFRNGKRLRDETVETVRARVDEAHRKRFATRAAAQPTVEAKSTVDKVVDTDKKSDDTATTGAAVEA